MGMWEDIEGDSKNGCLSIAWKPETVTKVCELLTKYHWMALRLMEDELHFNQEAVCQVCHEDRRKKISMKSAPFYIVSWMSKRSIVTVCEDFIQTKFLYDPETKCHSMDWSTTWAPWTTVHLQNQNRADNFLI